MFCEFVYSYILLIFFFPFFPVHSGDIVLEVNGISTEKLNLDQIKERVAGPRGSRVSIRYTDTPLGTCMHTHIHTHARLSCLYYVHNHP